MQMSSNEVEALKNYLRSRISYNKYYCCGEWHKADIHKVDILPDGRLAVYILLDNTIPNQISKIEFYNYDDSLFASGTETIDKESFSEDLLYRYTIAFNQTTA